MICEKCKKREAEVYYTENINGKETSLALCSECAGEMKIDGGLFMNGFFGGDPLSLMGSMFAPATSRRAGTAVKRCDLCGMSFADIAKEGKAGCPRCYDTFAEDFERSVAGIHGGTRHKGKVPAEYAEKLEGEKRIADIRKKISEAVAVEDYETAAALRDSIREIEGGGKTE